MDGNTSQNNLGILILSTLLSQEGQYSVLTSLQESYRILSLKT